MPAEYGYGFINHSGKFVYCPIHTIPYSNETSRPTKVDLAKRLVNADNIPKKTKLIPPTIKIKTTTFKSF